MIPEQFDSVFDIRLLEEDVSVNGATWHKQVGFTRDSISLTSPEGREVVAWLDDEAQMNAVTALSGSGPAYFFLVMEAMQNAAAELGLAPDTARRLCQQTALGAARMAIESGEDVSTLRERVTSPGGTTERGIEALESAGLRDAFREALTAAAARAGELADTLGGAEPQA